MVSIDRPRVQRKLEQIPHSHQAREPVLRLVSALKQCIDMRDLKSGESLHRSAIEAGFHREKYVAASLISMYSKCRRMASAHEVFNGLHKRDVVLWTSLISGYVENGEFLVAMELFRSMDCEPNSYTYVAALKACATLASENEAQKSFCLETGMNLHEQLTNSGLDSRIAVATTLIHMYSKCGEMKRARQVFNGMKRRNAITWNSLLFGYTDNGDHSSALELFSSMDCEPTSLSFVGALKACGGLACEKDKGICLRTGISLHCDAQKRGFHSNLVVATTLLDMYTKCGNMELAREVFDGMPDRSVVTWSSLILGYVMNEEHAKALELFSRMDCAPNSITYLAALKACGVLAWLDRGVLLHQEIRSSGLESHLAVATGLVDMYCKCRSLRQAREVFDRMNRRDVVSWNTILLGHVEIGEGLQAMELFCRMDCEPDYLTFVAMLKACGGSSLLSEGRAIHGLVCKLGLEEIGIVAAALMDLYVKCCSIVRAALVFDCLRASNLVAWNTLIAGFSSLGDSSQAFRLSREMYEAGVKPDGITFIALLSACSRAGLIEEGKRCFQAMPEMGICCSIDHFNCMVDMLGRANRCEEALELVRGMPMKPNAVTWMALLGASKNVEIGRVAFDALAADGSKPGAYVVMRDLYMKIRLTKMPSKL